VIYRGNGSVTYHLEIIWVVFMTSPRTNIFLVYSKKKPHHFRMSFPLPILTGSRDPQWLMLVRNMTKINSIWLFTKKLDFTKDRR
jgi:hypothetical protein